MDSRLLKICVLATLVAGISACDEGTESRLDCKGNSGRSMCVDTKYFMRCENGAEVVGTCDGFTVCVNDENGMATCQNTLEEEVTPCTDGEKQCSGSYIQTCTAGKWENAEEPCRYGCDSVTFECQPAPHIKVCNEKDRRCSGSTVQTCINNAWVPGAPCEKGCNKGVCIGEACNNEGAKQCADKIVQTCTDGRWTNADQACEFSCKDGECQPNPCGNGVIDDGEDCEGTNLNGKTCADAKPMSTGELSCGSDCKFVTDACILPPEGSDCDSKTFVESCDGTKVVWCYGGKVVNGTLDCAESNTSCIVLDVKGKPYAECIDETKKCDKAGEYYDACHQYSIYSDVGHYYCAPGSDNNNYGIRMDSEECSEPDAPACVKSTAKCGKIVDDQGSACVQADYPPACKGGIAVNCMSNGTSYNVYAEECDPDETCTILTAKMASGNILKQAMCMPASSECDTADKSDLACKAGNVYHNYCAPGDNGKNYGVVVGTDKCAHGCETGKTECIKLTEDEGTVCDDSFKARCDAGEVAVKCTKSTVAATQCANGLKCVIDDKASPSALNHAPLLTPPKESASRMNY